MSAELFRQEDLVEIKRRGMTLHQVEEQLAAFRRGMPFVCLLRPCKLGDGIRRINHDDFRRYRNLLNAARLSGRCMKFVPASGAASRMFRFLQFVADHHEHLDMSALRVLARKDADHAECLKFITQIKRFAFYDELREMLQSRGYEIGKLIAQGDLKILLTALLSDFGLGYSGKPKGLIPFHYYGRDARTPFEEHLVEAEHTAVDKNGKARVHFTIPEGMEEAIKDRLAPRVRDYQKKGVRFQISYSIQKRSTDTLACDHLNHPFRDEHGHLVFRPGGHGALLENLQALGGDIVFIKNIDNVVPDYRKKEMLEYKQVLAGYLLEHQVWVHGILKKITSAKWENKDTAEVVKWMTRELLISVPEDLLSESPAKQKTVLMGMLNRPIRVCGMVRNEGEPGGGPFWVLSHDGKITSQIVESSQVDMNIAEQRQIWSEATHFNPVDLVCGLRDYEGRSFDLRKFIDPHTGFISKKFQDGKELKALELPGLWNGSMAEWITLFVEVPMSTFSPVKTVMDLLRAEHQPKHS